MKQVVFHPEAFQELDEAVAYYAERSLWAATAFEEAVEKAVRSIATAPTRHAFLRQTGMRAFRLKRFPYLIIYEELRDQLWIAAVAHERRHPDYWRRRRPQ
jgi:plasmid stabilization system protein ParE